MQHITINQKPHPVKFGFRALAEYCELVGINLATMSNPTAMATHLSLQQCIILCWVGLKYGAKADGQPNPFASWEDLADALDNPENAATEILQAGLSAMANSVTPPPTKLDAEPEGKQKGSQ